MISPSCCPASQGVQTFSHGAYHICSCLMVVSSLIHLQSCIEFSLSSYKDMASMWICLLLDPQSILHTLARISYLKQFLCLKQFFVSHGTKAKLLVNKAPEALLTLTRPSFPGLSLTFLLFPYLPPSLFLSSPSAQWTPAYSASH